MRGIERAAAYVDRGPDNAWDAPSRGGAVGRLARRMLRRCLRPYEVRQHEFEVAVVAALRELETRQGELEAPVSGGSRVAVTPPPDLIRHVTGSEDPRWFLTSGQLSVRDIARALAFLGTSLQDYGRLLDFGCGCGRILLWLETVGQRSELYGVDIDQEAVAWASANVPWARVSVNQPLPPLDFPDAHFDLVFNHSVFTHLDESYQDAWLAELRRVTRPGGQILLTVHGDAAFQNFREEWINAQRDPEPIAQALREHGLVFVRDDNPTRPDLPDFYQATFHKPAYVFEHWGRYFEIRAYFARGALALQDLVLLTRL